MLQKLLSWPVIVGAIVIAIVLGVLGRNERSEMSRLADHGKQAVAKIEEVNWTSKRGMDRNFDLTVTFTTGSGESVRKTLRVDADTGRRARDDDDFVELPVVYLPEDTSVVRAEGDTDASTRMFALAAFAGVAGLILLVIRLRRRSA